MVLELSRTILTNKKPPVVAHRRLQF